MISLDFSNIKEKNLVNFDEYKARVKEIHNSIHNKTGEGNDFLGWLTWSKDYDKTEVERMIKKAQYVRENYDVLVVCGIGGSYLGACAAIDAINGLKSQDKLEIIYLGNNLDSDYTFETLEYLKKKRFAVCVISKSGTTTETAISFRILKEMLETTIGKEKAKDAIIAVTDKARGALRRLADEEGYETYIIPDDIGGRYSVITPVGLFPIACAGIDINEILAGFNDGYEEYSNPNLTENLAYQYAVERFYLYQKGYYVEKMISYKARLRSLNEWWKQLFDESEGKNRKALLTSSCIFTTDLHSLGQFIQEGSKILFETVINIQNPNHDVVIPFDKDDLDGLNYIAGKTIDYVNSKAFQGTLAAHSEIGNVPNIVINIDKITARSLGHLFYFFMISCAMSAYLLEVNPFNQPGVEVYKRNMFHLLGKKGY